MPRIQQLNQHVINKIAAGEVIERPASVVKELLENSVDALATRIEVDVAEGGSELIRVVDDGEGIHPDDLLLAVTSHATSKLRQADDLFRVKTLGFRGEALASISEVSQFRLRSRTAETPEGMEVHVEAGEFAEPRPCGCPVGTQIEVRQLFINTPVRRKFLKSASTELGHITEQFTRIALANPRLHLVLRHNQKLVYELPATDRLSDRLRLFYGGELADQLITVEAELNGTRMWGCVAHPSQNKATRKGQYLFLNGRWIQDRSLQHALGEAYRGLLMVGRYPIAFLFLEMPADLVDVNVHPTKSEVRFQDGQHLYRLMLSTLRTRFLGMNLEGDIKVGRGGTPVEKPRPVTADPQRRLELQQELADWARVQASQWSTSQWSPPAEDAPFESEFASAAPVPSARTGAFEESDELRNFLREPAPFAPFAALPSQPPPFAEREAESAASAGFAPSALPAEFRTPALPGGLPLRAMQIHNAYLVAETDEGLTVIDQHALHERVLYEQFRGRILAGAVESQRLLMPETLELGMAETNALLEHRELLARLGLGIEDFGGQTLLVNSYPAMLSRGDLGQLVRDIAEQLLGAGQAPTRRDLLDELLHMMSCKAAIKAGDRLTPEEIDSLLAQRHLIDDAHHCPHGRPSALVLSRAELDRQFGRMG